MSGGFEEKQQDYQSVDGQSSNFASLEREKVIIGKGGRLVIPAHMRKAMGIGEGEVMIVRVKEGELIAVPLMTAIKKAQNKLKHFKKPGESVVDEFIAERREEQLRSDRRFDHLHEEDISGKRQDL